MGAFFSLHEASEWKAAVENMSAPSIWSHASFSPLNRQQKVLLERPGRTEYCFPTGIRQGDDYIQIAAGSEVNLLVCFEEKTGRLYSSLLLKATGGKSHLHRKAHAQVTLSAPGNGGTMDASASQMSLAGGASLASQAAAVSGAAVSSSVKVQNVVYEQLAMSGSLQETLLEEVQAAVAAQVGNGSILPEHVVIEITGTAEAPNDIEVQIAILPPAGVKASAVMAALPAWKGSEAVTEHPLGAAIAASLARVEGLDSVCSGSPAVSHLTAARLHLDGYKRKHSYWMASGPGGAGSSGLVAKTPETMGDTEQLSQQLGLADDKDVEDCTWTHLLLYSVKEGVLVFFANDQESCEDVIREIASAYSVSPPGRVDAPVHVGHGTPTQVHAGTAAASSNALAAARLSFICHKVGRAQSICCRQISSLVEQDLARRFAVSGYNQAEEVNQVTNCVLFCLRSLREMQLPLRGHDVARICSDHPQLSATVGDVAASLWEAMWLQCGQSKSLQDDMAGSSCLQTRWQEWQSSGLPIGGQTKA
eukprot:TRINITY_DN21668_c0_g1_i1.p1 TRINITY_DN21668_c0_g1~~TRINITY_DN21668_c0_g1_i1.p1  ORF type:complete len:563 (-),score=140.82 TRINITY_DN21668_c0_g1_i1:195-1796(-)